MGLVGVDAEAFLALGFVGLVVAVAPDDFAIAFEGEDVGGDAIEEPAVVADDDGAAAEVDQGVFQGAKHVDVEVVGGFVQEQEVAAAFQELGEVDAVSFAAGEVADLLFLVGTFEIELGDVGSGGDFSLAEGHIVKAAADFLEDGVFGVQGFSALIDIGDDDGIADAEEAGVGGFLADDHAEERGFAGAVGTDDSDDSAGGEAEGHIIDQKAIAIAFFDVIGVDDEVAEVGAGGDLEDDGFVAFFDVLRGELFVAGEPSAVFSDAGSGGEADPFELAGEGFAAGAFVFFFLGEAFLLLLEPGGIVSLPGDALAAVELEDPAGDVIEEVAVVGDRDDGARVLVEVALEPGDAFGVEVVGGLVEEEDVVLFEEDFAEGDATNFAAGEGVDLGVSGGQAHGVHGDLEASVEVPALGGLDGVLDPPLLFQEFIHLIGVDGLAEAGVDGVEPVQEGSEGGDGLLDVAEHGLGAVEGGLLG